MRRPGRWLAAALIGWAGAALLYASAGHVSIVLLLGPIAFVAGDALAARHKARVQSVVDRAFVQLVSDDEHGFEGSRATVIGRRSRLLGVPPRLVDIRVVRLPDGRHFVVRAEARTAEPDAIAWRVTRLTDAEARAAAD